MRYFTIFTAIFHVFYVQAKAKPLLTKKQMTTRLNWAKDHRNDSKTHWHRIIWSDESSFMLNLGDTRSKVMRKGSEAFHPDTFNRTVKHPASVMIWGCMSAQGTGSLYFVDGMINSDKYISMLQTALKPSISALKTKDGEYVFQQDGASCHTSKKSMSWLRENDIPVLFWPSSSPDLSPIENVWAKMKAELRKNRPGTKQELKERLQQIWDSITPSYCCNLVETMPDRIKEVLKNKGGVTKY